MSGEREGAERQGDQEGAGQHAHEVGGDEGGGARTEFRNNGPLPPVANEGSGGPPSASDMAYGSAANHATAKLPGWLLPKSWKPTLLRKFPKPNEHGGAMPPPPQKYAGMHPAVQGLLWRSQDALSSLRDQAPEVEFWDRVDKVSQSDLQVLVQIVTASEKAGLGKYLNVVNRIYNFGSSWGVHFLSSGNPLAVALNGHWGKDMPQAAVRREHEGSAHEWYRQDTGPGNPGLHLGIDDGEGNHNVHIDPTNPMDHVSGGLPTMGPGGIILPPLFPIGTAVYNPQALLDHAKEIGVIKDPNFKAKPTASEPWFGIGILGSFAGAAHNFGREEDECADTKNKGRAKQVRAKMDAAANAATALEQKSRALAMQDNSKNPDGVEALKAERDKVAHEFFVAMTEYFEHMYADAGYSPPAADPRQVATWSLTGGLMDWAHKRRVACQQKRRGEPVVEAA